MVLFSEAAATYLMNILKTPSKNWTLVLNFNSTDEEVIFLTLIGFQMNFEVYIALFQQMLSSLDEYHSSKESRGKLFVSFYTAWLCISLVRAHFQLRRKRFIQALTDSKGSKRPIRSDEYLRNQLISRYDFFTQSLILHILSVTGCLGLMMKAS